MKVWILQDCDYDGGTVFGVFTSEEKAEKYKKVTGRTYAESYEYELNPLDDVPDGNYPFYVRMDNYNGFEAYQTNDGKRHTPTFYNHFKAGEMVMNVIVYAENKEDAMTQAEAIKKEWLKNNTWPND
jgi:hypothetical protein